MEITIQTGTGDIADEDDVMMNIMTQTVLYII